MYPNTVGFGNKNMLKNSLCYSPGRDFIYVDFKPKIRFYVSLDFTYILLQTEKYVKSRFDCTRLLQQYMDSITMVRAGIPFDVGVPKPT